MSKRYSEAEKREAVAAYVVSGTFKGAAKVTGTHWQTIQSWKKKNPAWWDRIVAEVWEQQEEKIRVGFSQIVNAGAKGLLDRLKNGDIKIDANGKSYTVPLSDEDRMCTIRVLANVYPLKVVDGLKANK